MDKTWEKMTQTEKIEDLRKDVKAIFQHLNDLQASQSNLGHRLDGVFSLASEAAKKVERLTPQS
ncbi:MAG TPA: hypothetical protein VMU78_06465 [Methylocella sp.]|nr:hypothetical protein [Methylocella sp.]